MTVIKNGVAYTFNNPQRGGGSSSLVKIKAVDAATTPVGVTWKQGQTTITGTLEASEATKDCIVFVPSSSKVKNLYDEYVVMEENGSYSWEKLGKDIDVPEEVVYGYLLNGTFYSDSGHAAAITPALNTLYIDKTDMAKPKQYIWNGTAYVGYESDLERRKAEKDGYYQTLSAGYADKAGDLDIQTSAMVRHTQVAAIDTTDGDKDVKDGRGFVRIIRGTENGITAAGAKIISLGFNLIPSGNGTTFTFYCKRGEWGAYGTSAKNNGYLFADSENNILIPVSVKQNGVDVPTHTDHGNTYYLPQQDGQCTVVFATAQVNPCGHLCWSNGRDTKDNYEPYNASIVDLAPAINAIGGTLRRVGYVFDEINLETRQSTRRLGKILLNALAWIMEAGPTYEEGEATNTFRAIVSGGVATADTIKAGGAFAIKGLSGMTFSLDGTSLVCDSTIASVEDFVTALGSGTIEYELAVEVVASNTLDGQITISDYGIIIFENTEGAGVVDIDFDFDTKWRDFIKNLPDDLSTKDRVLAEALCDLNKRLSGIEAMIDKGFPSLKVDDLTIARALFTRIALGDLLVKKAGNPTTIPAGVIQFYRNTTDNSIWLSVGSESVSDWIKIK